MINIMDDKMKNALTKLQPKVTKTGRTDLKFPKLITNVASKENVFS